MNEDMQGQPIGQRIQGLRKAAGLSQEALAAQVGVSRQAISKWEAGLSLPGIDNLQALSQVLGTSIDELLGGCAPAQQTPQAPGEAVALGSVKALLQAQSEAERTHRRRALPWKLAAAALAAALAVGLVFAYQAQLNALQERVGKLSGEVSGLQSTLQGQISSIRSGIEESLREQASLVASYAYDLGDYDRATRTIRLSVSAAAKQIVAGTTASFTVSSPGSQPLTLPAQEQGNGNFAAEGRIPVADELHISLSLLLPDGAVQNQELWVEYGLANQYILNVSLGSDGLTFTKTESGILFDGALALYIEGGGLDEPLYPQQAQVELYLGGRLVRTYPVEVYFSPAPGGSDSAAEIAGAVTYYVYPGQSEQGPLPALPYSEGEDISFRAYVRDNLGQEYEVWHRNLGKPIEAAQP